MGASPLATATAVACFGLSRRRRSGIDCAARSNHRTVDWFNGSHMGAEARLEGWSVGSSPVRTPICASVSVRGKISILPSPLLSLLFSRPVQVKAARSSTTGRDGHFWFPDPCFFASGNDWLWNDWLWPMDGFVYNGTFYLALMQWHAAGGRGAFGFAHSGRRLANIGNCTGPPNPWSAIVFLRRALPSYE
jgi:hypothetical protein